MPVTKAQVKQTALSFPGAHEKPHYGNPSFFIEKKFFTRIRDQDASIVMRVGSIEQRDMMLELDPGTYFITDHYRDWAGVLVRMSAITPTELKIMLERIWRQIAPKKLLRESDGEAAPVKKPAKPPARKTVGKKPSKKAVKATPKTAARAKKISRKAKV